VEENARLIATDSGGVQREAYFHGVPCLTLRSETEWEETVQVGWNKLVGVRSASILESWHDFSPPSAQPSIFGDGSAAQRIVQILEERAFAGGSIPESGSQIGTFRVGEQS
jgi:UDP-N-acetylglucosamine 2-epimerase